MKKTKVGMLFLCFILVLSSFGFATEEVVSTIDVDSNITMTLDEAVEFALKNNANVVDIKKMVSNQEDAYQDAADTYRSWKNKIRNGGYAFESELDYLNCWGYSFELAELSYKSFLATKGTAEETVGYTVKQLAYTIDELGKTIELLEKTILKQERDVKIAEVKSTLNMITSLEVEAAKQTLNSTKLQLESLKPTLGTVKTTLKNLMGIDVTKDLTITLPEAEFKILEVPNLTETIENSLETNGEAITAKLAYKQKEINNILATKTNFWTREEKKDAKKDFSDAELRLNNSLNVIKENLMSLYTEVKNSEESTILAKSEYEQLQIKYKQMQVMHELGMITTHDFNSYEIALINAKNTYESSLQKNILLNERWNIALKVGDVLAKEAR